MLSGLLSAVEDTVQIDVDDGLPLVGSHGEAGGVLLNSRVGNKDRPVGELGRDLVEDSVDVLVVADVALLGDDLGAVLLSGLLGPVEGRGR